MRPLETTAEASVDHSASREPSPDLAIGATIDPEAEVARADARIAREDTEAEADDGWEWAVVEIMGHRRHAGRVREEERFGAKLLRIDIPNQGDADRHGWTTHYYPGSALFSFSPATREACLKINRPYAAAARLSYSAPDDDDGDDEALL